MRWREVVRQVFCELPGTDRTIFPELWDHFGCPHHWRIDAGVAPLWRRLRKAGLRVGVASNFDDRLESLCRQMSPLDSAAFVFHSAQLGARKPAARFFTSIQQQLQTDPAALLMVGDDRAADYRGALEAGWQAVWLDRKGRGRPSDVRRISRLGELADRLLLSELNSPPHADFRRFGAAALGGRFGTGSQRSCLVQRQAVLSDR